MEAKQWSHLERIPYIRFEPNIFCQHLDSKLERICFHFQQTWQLCLCFFFPIANFFLMLAPHVHPFLQIMVSSTHVSFTLAIIHPFLQTMVCSIHVCFSLTTSLLELLQHRVAKVFEIIQNVENFVITFTEDSMIQVQKNENHAKKIVDLKTRKIKRFLTRKCLMSQFCLEIPHEGRW